MKNIASSSSDFITIRENDCCYVDKTMIIAGIIRRNKVGVTLFTRPRRFGKSLNLSMMDAFFNIRYADVSDRWFQGLRICSEPEYAEYRGRYPVVRLSLKDVSCRSYSLFLGYIRMIFERTFYDLRPLVESDERCRAELDVLGRISDRGISEPELVDYLQTLVRLLYIHYDSKVVLLIDEYDLPLNSSFGSDTFPDVMTFMRCMLGLLLKDNPMIRLAVLTGVMPVSKESIFSGLNNIFVDSVLSSENSDMFGFTEDEVRRICTDYHNPDAFEVAREWYDGYRFGGSDMYNPLSVLRFVSSGFEAGPYWAGTSGNSILDTLIRSADPKVYSDLDRLSSGDRISESIDTSASYNDMVQSRRGLYSYMVMTGYLNAVPGPGGSYVLSIPNHEIACVFDSKITELMKAGSWDGSFLGSALSGDIGKMKDILGGSLEEVRSVRQHWTPETYQAVVAVLARCPERSYKVVSDREYGDGFCDIRITNPKPAGPHIVIEVKSTDDPSKDLHELSRECIRQVHARRYYDGLQGSVLLYGIAFCGKRFEIDLESVLTT